MGALSEVLEQKVDKDENEHGLNKAGTGLLVPGPHGWEHQVLCWGGGTGWASLDHRPDQARHELYQLL